MGNFQHKRIRPQFAVFFWDLLGLLYLAFFLLPGAGRPKAFLILESHRGKLINWIRPNRSAGCARNRIRSAGLTASCSNRSAGFTAQTDYIGRGLENTGSTNDRKCI